MNRYLTQAHLVRGDKAVTAGIKHATKTRDAQDATVRAIVGVTYVSGIYAKTFVTTHVASRKSTP